MKIYAIRDRLIDYYLNPFAGPDDRNVLAAIAEQVNNTETISAIAQAPHHFEVWCLGEVQADGHIAAKKELIADCSSLIRRGIRSREERTAGSDRLEGPESARRERQSGDREEPGTPGKAPRNAAQATAEAVTGAHPAVGRGHTSPN